MPWILLLAVLVPGAAQAVDASSCYGLPSADARAYCLARAHGDPGRCYAVQDPALRATCLAEVRN